MCAPAGTCHCAAGAVNLNSIKWHVQPGPTGCLSPVLAGVQRQEFKGLMCCRLRCRASACIVNLAVGRPAAMNKLAEAGIIPVAVRKLAQATDRSSVHRISLILAELAKSPEHEANIIQCARSAGALSRILAPASSGKSSATAAPENEPSTPEGLGTAAASEIGSTEEKVDVLTTGVPGVSASGDPQMIRAVMGAVYGELAEKPTKIVQPGQWQSSESGSLEADDTEEAAEEAMEEAT